jgi:hypothetical protein
VGLQAQLPEVADEAAAGAHGQEQGDEQGDQAEDACYGRLQDDLHRDRVDAVLVAVLGPVVERAELVERVGGGGVPALGGHPVRHAGRGGGRGLLGRP